MANELTNAIKSAATKVSSYIDDLSKMTVETRCMDLNTQSLTFEGSKAVARTDLSMDGDCSTILPTRLNVTGEQAIDAEMFQAHQQVVAMAIEYRARMLASLTGMFGMPSAPLPAPPTLPTGGLPKG